MHFVARQPKSFPGRVMLRLAILDVSQTRLRLQVSHALPVNDLGCRSRNG